MAKIKVTLAGELPCYFQTNRRTQLLSSLAEAGFLVEEDEVSG
jgi:hypothetical protein